MPMVALPPRPGLLDRDFDGALFKKTFCRALLKYKRSTSKFYNPSTIVISTLISSFQTVMNTFIKFSSENPIKPRWVFPIGSIHRVVDEFQCHAGLLDHHTVWVDILRLQHLRTPSFGFPHLLEIDQHHLLHDDHHPHLDVAPESETKKLKHRRISNAVQVTLWLSVTTPQCHD